MAAEQLVFPGSSYLSGGTYDAEAKLLTVEFVTGGVTEHRGVPKSVVDSLQAGGGSYYRRALYGRYGALNI